MVIGSLTACELPFGKIHDAKSKVRAELRDPESAIFRNVRTGSFGKNYVCGEVKGKNGWGGYGDFNYFFVETEIGAVLFLPEDDSENRTITYNLYILAGCTEYVPGVSGKIADGKRQGLWEIRLGPYVQSGEYVDGKKNGLWREQFADEASGLWLGGIRAGNYLDGKKNGQWKERRNSIYSTGPYVDSVKHGKWEAQQVDEENFLKSTSSGEYVGGKRYGEWVIKYYREGAEKSTSTGEYVSGKKHGEWVTQYTDHRDNPALLRGKTYHHTYVDGELK